MLNFNKQGFVAISLQTVRNRLYKLQLFADFFEEVEKMINKEMLSLGKKASVIREIFEYSKRRKAEIGEENVFDFSLGNPSIPAPKKVDDTIINLINNESSVALHGYTSAVGDMAVKEKIANNIKERFGFPAKKENIYMTCGAAASLSIALKAVCANEGDEVILLSPFFPEYTVFSHNAGLTPIIVKCVPPDFSIDFKALSAAINEKTAAIIVNSPNNPSGAIISEEQTKELADLLKEKSKEFSRGIYLISDEPYRELVYDNAVVPYFPNIYDNTIVCYSYSKSLSLPGERIGYILVSHKAQDAPDLFAAVCGAGRSLGYVCAPSMMQKVVAECDGGTADISEYDKNRKLLYNGLREIGYEAVYPQGAFYLFVKALEDDANKFYEKAKAKELLVVPSDSFGVTGYVRISYCVEYSQIERSLPAFKELYEEYMGGKND